jgi:hypothetical protein
MTRPSPDGQPTLVQQVTAGQPGVTAAPATRRAAIWQRKVPTRIGRARTSTVVIGCLFVLLYGLNAGLPQDPYVTVPLPDGGSVRVRSSQISPAPSAPVTTPPATTSEAPASTSSTAPTTATTPPTLTTGAPPTTAGQTTTTAPRATTTPPNETTPAPTTSRAPTSVSRAPVTTAGQEPTAEAPTTGTPTG